MAVLVRARPETSFGSATLLTVPGDDWSDHPAQASFVTTGHSRTE